MTDFLDDLARSLAKPMPRHRALRMFGGALVSIAVPGALRPPMAWASPAGTTLTTQCNPSCGGNRPLKCVCPAKGGCFIGGCGEVGSTCCCFEESNAGIPGAVVCPPGTRCGGGKGKPNCVCLRPCGDTCCKVGETCADPDLGYCCTASETPCRGGKTVNCCKPTEYCCSGKCCPPRTRCQPGNPGTCGPCPPKSKKCGKTCCIKGENCCNGKCCKKTEKCCSEDHCCEKTETCCGERCCNDQQKCCGDRCCPKQQECCGDKCCKEGTTCYKQAGRFGCCPDERLAQTPAGKVCCPDRFYAEQGTCCPTGRACTECDPPCRRGEYCQDGFCLPGSP